MPAERGARSGARADVLVLCGPTASGKTAVGVVLARLLGGEIVSADARQVYRRLEIGTAKPRPEDLRRAPHHCVDILNPDEEYSAGRYSVHARALVAEIRARGRLPIVVGGSGLYIRALVDGLFGGPAADSAIRARFEERGKREGIRALLAQLRRVDPESAVAMREPTLRRVIRALEVYEATGVPLSRLQREAPSPPGFRSAFFGLALERKELYARIEERCEAMLRAGLCAEVEMLERDGYADAPALKTVGYAEALAYRRGEISFSEMVRLFKQNSRRYAKRQMTWFRRDPRVHWVDAGGGRSAEGIGTEIARGFAAAF